MTRADLLKVVGCGAIGACLGLVASLFGLTHAAPACGPASGLVDSLSRDFGEAPLAAGREVGPAASGIMLLGNPATGTWTALNLRPDGTACIESSGTGFWLTDIIPTPQTGDPL